MLAHDPQGLLAPIQQSVLLIVAHLPAQQIVLVQWRGDVLVHHAQRGAMYSHMRRLHVEVAVHVVGYVII